MGKLRRAPYRCRGCHKRFYVYVPPEKDEMEAVEHPANGGETPDSDVPKPAEP